MEFISRGEDTMFDLIAPCGLDCAKCESYILTQANDADGLAVLAEKWGKEYNAPGLTAVNIQCDGCMADGRKNGHCAECQIRLCAVERSLPNCAVCTDYSCEKLEGLLVQVPQARANLEAIRKTG